LGKAASDAGIEGGILAGVALVLRERYLLGIVCYLLLHTFASTMLYLEQARIVAQALADTAARTRLFALADLGVSCLSLLLQAFVTGRFIRHLGVAAALAALPLAGMLAFAAIALWPSLPVLVAAQGMRRAIDFAIARPAREVLFTVVSRAAKYKAKNVIETVIYRGGDAASGWVFSLLAAAGMAFSGIAILSVPLAALWIALSAWLARRQDEMAASRMRQDGPAGEGAPAAGKEQR
jgi:AAA family ATP:ADP antiporter